MVKVACPATACNRFVNHRTARHFLHILAKVADRQFLGDRNITIIRRFLTGHHTEKSRLASTVGAHQTHFFTGVQLKGGINEDQLLAILLVDV